DAAIAVLFGGTKHLHVRQASDDTRSFQLHPRVHGAAEQSHTARIGSGEVFSAQRSGGAGSKLVDTTVLKQNQWLPGFDAVNDNRLVVNPAVQIGLNV